MARLTDLQLLRQNPRRRRVPTGLNQDIYWRIKRTSPANLISYWPQDELSGAVARNHGAGGNARSGAYTGVTLGNYGIGDDRFCPYFDGANDYNNILTAGLIAAFNGAEGSIAMWAKVFSGSVYSDGIARSLMYLYGDGSNQVIVQKSLVVNGGWYGTYKSGGVSFSRLAPSLGIGWLCFVITWSASADQLKFYLNGVQQGTTATGLGVWGHVLASAAVGASNVSPTGVFNGYIAHAAIWTTPMSENQVKYLYNGGA